jgi:hypothetical protein
MKFKQIYNKKIVVLNKKLLKAQDNKLMLKEKVI